MLKGINHKQGYCIVMPKNIDKMCRSKRQSNVQAPPCWWWSWNQTCPHNGAGLHHSGAGGLHLPSISPQLGKDAKSDLGKMPVEGKKVKVAEAI